MESGVQIYNVEPLAEKGRIGELASAIHWTAIPSKCSFSSSIIDMIVLYRSKNIDINNKCVCVWEARSRPNIALVHQALLSVLLAEQQKSCGVCYGRRVIIECVGSQKVSQFQSTTVDSC